MFTAIAITVLVIIFLSSAVRILNEYERGVIFRLGRVIAAKGPGLIILIPVVDKMVKVSLRLVAMDVLPQDVITRDNVSVKVNAVIYFSVIDAVKAIIEVENYNMPSPKWPRRPCEASAARPSWMNCCRRETRSTLIFRKYSIPRRILGNKGGHRGAKAH